MTLDMAESVTILPFAGAREVFGFAEKIVPFETHQTVDALLKDLCPDWRERLADCRIAVDLEFAGPSTVLRPGQTVAVIPPVSGG
jgi:molybdopterin converting factor small subunit